MTGESLGTTVPKRLDEERDCARLAIALGATASSLHAFFAQEPRGKWGADLADSAKRAATFEELALSAEILAKMLDEIGQVAELASSGPELRRIHEKVLAIMKGADKRAAWAALRADE